MKKNKFMLSYFSVMGAGRQLTGTCLDSCARAGHSSPSPNTHPRTHVPSSLLDATTLLNKYTDTKYWAGILTHPLPPHKHVCTHMPSDIPFPLPTCQGSRIYTHTHARTHTKTTVQTHVSLIRKLCLVDKWRGVHILPLAWRW